MVTDLPDYEKKIIIVTPPGEYPAIVQVDLRKILGEDFITPTIAGCVPSSIENEAIAYDEANDWFKTYIENDAIAYDSVNDRFKVDIEALTLGALTVIQPDESLLKATVTQAAKDRTVTGTVTAEQSDASKLKATVSATDLDIRNLTTTDRVETCPDSDTTDMSDGTTNYVRVPIDASIRAVHDIVYPKMFNGTTWDRIRGTVTGGLLVNVSNADLDIRPLINTDVVSVEQSDETKLKATVTQAAKDRTVTGTVTAEQATKANLNANVFTKHDNKTYKTAVFDASASGNLVAAVAGKVIKLHAMTIQAQNTVVVNLNNGSGGSSLMEWSFQAREGAVIPMANAPAYWAITGVNTALYVTLSAAVVVTITAIYSDDDSS